LIIVYVEGRGAVHLPFFETPPTNAHALSDRINTFFLTISSHFQEMGASTERARLDALHPIGQQRAAKSTKGYPRWDGQENYHATNPFWTPSALYANLLLFYV
jgi:hypothetical protein